MAADRDGTRRRYRAGWRERGWFHPRPIIPYRVTAATIAGLIVWSLLAGDMASVYLAGMMAMVVTLSRGTLP